MLAALITHPNLKVHLLIYIVPICIKFQYDALYATFLLVGVLGIFKAYPTMSDPGIFLSMISLFPETYPCELLFVFY